MSADSWATCPGCVKKLAAEKEALAERIQKAYGLVTEEEYIELLLEQGELEEQKRDVVTLGEYWDIGIQDEVFIVSYRARCDKCGFTHKFTHKETINL